MKQSAQIRKLAEQQGITAAPEHIDHWADKISELSGESGEPSDEIEQILINLRRAEKIDPALSQQLFHLYTTTEKYPYMAEMTTDSEAISAPLKRKTHWINRKPAANLLHAVNIAEILDRSLNYMVTLNFALTACDPNPVSERFEKL